MMRQRSFFAYDTLCTICAEFPQECDAERALVDAQGIALEVESTLSMFDPSSEISRLMDTYTPGIAYSISDMLCAFLDTNLHLAELTQGAFDPTVGPLIKLWDFTADDPKIPDPVKVSQMLDRVGYQHIRLNAVEKTIMFDAPGIVIDPGASGKGFALGLVADHMRRCGVTAGVSNFGGNIFVIGKTQDEAHDSQRPWKVAIINPDDRQTVVGRVDLEDMGIATSSWYEHCFVHENKVFHHLLDTRTGMPKPLCFKSVSILSTNAFLTDLLSTAFFILDEEKGKSLLERFATELGEKIEYVAVLEDGSVSASPGAGFHPIHESC